MNLKELLRDHLPNRIHETLIGFYNRRLHDKRRSGEYKTHRDYYEKWDHVSDLAAIKTEQQRRLTNFMNQVARSSKFYAKYIKERPCWTVEDLKRLPVVTKNDLVEHLSEICTINPKGANISYTGGTTGASLKVLYTDSDVQQYCAAIDGFRAKFGYQLGKKTAWFSGKELLSKRDIKAERFYKDDRFNRIRFYSTFHFNQETANAYWNALRDYAPEFIVGFPFSVYDICRYGELNGWNMDLSHSVFFPTAETVTEEHRRCIGKVLGCRIIDQYASSEGAPLILECDHGRLHIHPLTGIFEVVDDDLNPATSGQILVTSFTTTGTPLVRYQIGDMIALDAPESKCGCGSVFPIVASIQGRVGDFLVSKETGRISGANLGNATKYVSGILCFQATQNCEDRVNFRVVSNEQFDENQERKFVAAMRERLGHQMEIVVQRVDEIPKSKSGKFKMIVNKLPPVSSV